MNLKDYQTAALSTAMPRAFDHKYLVPMIVGEIGELFGQKAKAHWHGWSEDQLKVELVSEYGDVCWGTAILLHTLNVDELDPIFDKDSSTARAMRRRQPEQTLLSHGSYLWQWYSEEETQPYIKGEAMEMWAILEAFCEEITGVPFETVLQANLEKLRSRAERNVLIGSGDHR